jgi:hypothetical protein
MDSRRKMAVVDWVDSPPPVPLTIRVRCRFFPPTLIGIIGTVLLHAMLIQSVSFRTRGPSPKPLEAQDSAKALPKSATAADSLVLISMPAIAKASPTTGAISSLPDLSKMKINSRISTDLREFFNVETLALSEDQASTPNASGTDGAERARLFGIYTGQIQARIDRVWRRPRSRVNEDSTSPHASDAGDSFQCEAQIVQDVWGNVREILLPRCNGSPAWQQSLVLAIQQASPLPAPPSAKVFSYSISLLFVGLPFSPTSPPDEYEREPRKLVQSN